MLMVSVVSMVPMMPVVVVVRLLLGWQMLRHVTARDSRLGGRFGASR